MNRQVFTARPPEHSFTYSYAQPKEYHFCLDSIIFAYFLSLQISPTANVPESFRALDLCAGCGVVGLELSYYHRWIQNFDFLEIQSLFRASFEENLRITNNADKNYRFLESDFRTLEQSPLKESYDLIVANPPYFRPREGSAPLGEVRQRARFFNDANPQELFHAIEAALKPGGRAYVLMRPGSVHGRNNEKEIAGFLSPNCRWSIPAEIRGTWVIELHKEPLED